MIDVTLCPLLPEDHEQFIRDNQDAFNYGALEEFGRRDDYFEKDNEIISRETIERQYFYLHFVYNISKVIFEGGCYYAN